MARLGERTRARKALTSLITRELPLEKLALQLKA
jgi:hypothetical protein